MQEYAQKNIKQKQTKNVKRIFKFLNWINKWLISIQSEK